MPCHGPITITDAINPPRTPMSASATTPHRRDALDDLLGDGKTNTEPAAEGVCLTTPTIEAFEYPGLVFGRNPRTLI